MPKSAIINRITCIFLTYPFVQSPRTLLLALLLDRRSRGRLARTRGVAGIRTLVDRSSVLELRHHRGRLRGVENGEVELPVLLRCLEITFAREDEDHAAALRHEGGYREANRERFQGEGGDHGAALSCPLGSAESDDLAGAALLVLPLHHDQFRDVRREGPAHVLRSDAAGAPVHRREA